MVGKARKMNNDSIDRKNQKEDVAFRKFNIGFCFKVMMISGLSKMVIVCVGSCIHIADFCTLNLVQTFY